MPATSSPRLLQVANLSDLIGYLRDELGWPIAPDTVIDDLTFDWSAMVLVIAMIIFIIALLVGIVPSGLDRRCILTQR